MRRLALVALVALAACGGPSLERGTVIGREYDDPDTWVTTSCVPMAKGGMICSPVTHQDGEHWLLVLQGVVDGETVTDTVEVSPDLYETCRDGWTYPECKPR